MVDLLPLVEVEGQDPLTLATKVRVRVRDQAHVERDTLKIVEKVRKGGDGTLRELTREFDHSDDWRD